MPFKKRISSYKYASRKRNPKARRRIAKRVRAKQLTRFRPTSSLGPFSTKKKAVLRYYEEGIVLNPGVGTLARFPIIINDPVSPDSRTAVATHQPRGYNTLSQMYDHANVIFATLEVFFFN